MKYESDHNNINHLRNTRGDLLDQCKEGKMTLDEAIKHCEEKARELRRKAFDDYENDKITLAEFADCRECAKEHEQLAEWLKELKAYRECPLTQDECFFCNPDKCHNAKEGYK